MGRGVAAQAIRVLAVGAGHRALIDAAHQAGVERFVCTSALALTRDPAPGPSLEIGGPGNLSNGEVTALDARLAGIEPRISHLQRPVARQRASTPR